MAKRIWILNHYAANMYFDQTGRHHSFAKYLIQAGYNIKIFCANTVHNSTATIDTEEALSIEKVGENQVPYVFLKTRPYEGNGKKRIMNMIDYSRNLNKVLDKYCREEGKPDLILASSVHPLTLYSGIKAARKLKISCICEIRDLWPETFVQLGMLRNESSITKLLYRGERWIYERANKLIFTMPGGKEYIKDREWEDRIDIDKVHYISNGVDLEKFDYDKRTNQIDDADLHDGNYFNIVYTGSVRLVNKVEELVKLADIYTKKNISNVRLLIYGDGDQKQVLEKVCSQKGLNNIIFKGKIDKKYIPYVVSNADLNVVTGADTDLGKYGVSWNKLFEYMASGKPMVANYDMGTFNLIEDHNMGIAKRFSSIEEFSSAILKCMNWTESERVAYEKNARKAADDFDYKKLTKDLISILEH